MFKSGFVAIIGKTNVGKSSLLNRIVGEEVAITTSKPQTTRTAIKGIINRKDSQIVFIDTPGIHKAQSKYGEAITKIAFDSLKEVDVILYLLEATNKELSKQDETILEKLKETKRKVILVLTKIDLVKKEELLILMERLSKSYNFESIVPVSAKKGKQIEELLTEIELLLPEGPKYYEEDEYTDQTERQIVEEVIREKSLKLLRDEVPHGIYVSVQKMKLRKTKDKKDIYDIEVNIYCTRQSHKGIIIGKNGTMLKNIGTFSREKIEKILGTKVNMKLWVKVKEDWLNDENVINNITNNNNF